MNGLTIQPNGQTLVVTAGPSNFYSDTGLSSAVTYPVTVSSTTVWYCSGAVAVAVPDVSLVITQTDGSTIYSGSIRVGQTSDTFVRPQPSPFQVAADLPDTTAGHVFGSGATYRPGGVSGYNTGAATQSRLEVIPWMVTGTLSIDRLYCDVTTGAGSSFIRPVIFKDDGTGLGMTLVVDGGQVDASAIATVSATVAATLPPDLYYIGAVAQGGTPAIRYVASFNGPVTPPIANYTTASFSIRKTGVTGAPAASYTFTGADVSANAHAVWFRVV